MMYFKRTACAVLSSMLMLSGLCVNAQAAERILVDGPVEILTLERATNRFDWEIPSGKHAKAGTSFTLEAGDTVNITASYFPQDAMVYFGLEDSNGTYYFTSVTNGSVNKTFRITKSGKYTLVIKNRSSEQVEVTGYVRS